MHKHSSTGSIAKEAIRSQSDRSHKKEQVIDLFRCLPLITLFLMVISGHTAKENAAQTIINICPYKHAAVHTHIAVYSLSFCMGCSLGGSCILTGAAAEEEEIEKRNGSNSFISLNYCGRIQNYVYKKDT